MTIFSALHRLFVVGSPGRPGGQAPATGWADDHRAGHVSTEDTVASDEAISTEDTVASDEAISTEDTVASDEAISTDDTVESDDAVALRARMADGDGGVVAEPVGAGRRHPLPTVDPTLYVRGAELARGGMGRILQARDRKLGRDLAIKELLFHSPALEARFEREMKITARLQHPAIITVHDAGRWPSGEAFYTMKHVEGEALDRVIDKNRELRERLALLPTVLAVADALAYAHAQGVIHRDLKPGNILVGAFGETVVIDWGLAKDLRDTLPDESFDAGDIGSTGEGVTIVGEALGTPAYMPREQAQGQILDERADVYAIGAILYHVLSGAKPYADTNPGSAADLLLTVVERGPTRLSKLQPDIPPDLLTIVEKAMSREPSARYATASELAADLRRYQTGQLVGAHQYSTWALAKRWVRRRRAAVGVAVIMAAVLAVGAAASFGRIASERDLAESERRRANEQKSLAEENRGEVEELLDFMLVDLRNQLEPLGQLELLDAVATKAVEYYQARPDTDSDNDLRRRSHAHTNIGDVLFPQGRLPEALVQFRVARAISEKLAAKDPGNVTWQRNLALGHLKVGEVLLAQANSSGALAAFRTTLSISERLVAQDPGNATLQRDLSVARDRVGDVLRAQGDSPGALAAYRTSLASRAVLAALAPGDTERQRDLSASYDKVGDILNLQGDSSGALAAYRSALAIDEGVAAQDSGSAISQRALSASHHKIGDVLLAKGDSSGALVAYRTALAINEMLAARDPSNAAWQRSLSLSYENVGNVLFAEGDSLAALVAYRRSLAISETLAAQDPSNAAWQRDLAVSHLKVGEVLRGQARWSGALAAFRAALAISRTLAAQDPGNATWQTDLAAGHVQLGGILLKKGEQSVAREHLARAAVLYERSAAVGLDFYNAGCTYALSGNSDKAFEMLDKAIALGERDYAWAQKDSDLASLRKDPRWKPLIEKMKRAK